MTRGKDLTRNDILRLAMGLNLPKVGPPILQRIRQVHHLMARHLAAGKSLIEVASIVNYTPQRVGDLTRDPNFAHLVAHYVDMLEDSQVDKMEKFKAMQMDIADLAQEEILSRLEDPKKISQLPVAELRALSGSALDRVGLPSMSAQPGGPQAPTKITFNIAGRGITPKDVKDAKDVTPQDITPQPKQLEHHNEDDS
jgi:hypothetical protein